MDQNARAQIPNQPASRLNGNAVLSLNISAHLALYGDGMALDEGLHPTAVSHQNMPAAFELALDQAIDLQVVLTSCLPLKAKSRANVAAAAPC